MAVRPRVRKAQWAERAAIALIAALGVTAYAVVKRFPTQRLKPGLASTLLPSAFRVDEVTFEEASPVLRQILTHDNVYPSARWGLWKPYGEARRLTRDFPFLRSVSVDREWTAHRVRFHVALKEPIARVTRHGRPWGWLSADGSLFQAPAELFSEADRPQVELGDDREPQGPAIAAFLGELSADSFSARLVSMELRSPEQGWELTLADGGKIAWGELRWTAEKIERLKQVLGDARSRGKTEWTPDLRYFGEGRILLRPLARASARNFGRSER